jgi:hypothetical protein
MNQSIIVRCPTHQIFTSGGLTGGFRICPTDCNVRGIFGYITSANDTFIQLFDKSTEPVTGDIPLMVWVARAGDNFFCQIPPDGLPFVYGPWLKFSSTANVLTPQDVTAVVSGTIIRP